jgi:hypothetical protein
MAIIANMALSTSKARRKRRFRTAGSSIRFPDETSMKVER